MSKAKTAKQIAQGVYRDLGKLYGIEVDESGRVDSRTSKHIPLLLEDKIEEALRAVQHKVESLPEPIRPAGRNVRTNSLRIKPTPGGR